MVLTREVQFNFLPYGYPVPFIEMLLLFPLAYNVIRLKSISLVRVHLFLNLYFSTDILHFIVLHRYCVFYKLKVCGNAALSKSISTIFPKAFAHFVSLGHVLVSLTIFQTFSLLYLLHDLWSVIFSFFFLYSALWELFPPFYFPTLLSVLLPSFFVIDSF